MNQNKVNNICKILLIIFLIIQPIFDLKIFYNSISTLIRAFVILILFIITFILDNNKKKYWLFLLFGFICIYFIFHHINASVNFHSLVPGNFNYSVIQEIAYILKMISPFLLLYTCLKLNLEKKEIKKIICGICFIVSSIIIISNIFVFSYSSYTDSIIKDNIFSWFKNTASRNSHEDLLSKGLFEYANQISAILLMFLPFCIYYVIEEKKLKYALVLVFTIIALLLIGTRTSIFGIPIIFLYMFLILIFFQITKRFKYFTRETISINALAISFYILILLVHPIFNRFHVYDNTIKTNSDISADVFDITSDFDKNTSYDYNEKSELYIENSDTNYNKDISDFTEYVGKEYKSFIIPDQFILQAYPYEYDPEFWYDIFQKPVESRVDYRYLETAMIKRVVEINNNKLDFLLGITNTRLQNIFNIERDFVVQYYALGIIGLILLIFPYIGLLLYYIHLCLKYKDKYFNPINIISFVTIAFLLYISYYSGNLLNSLSFTIYFTILFRLLFLKKETC